MNWSFSLCFLDYFKYFSISFKMLKIFEVSFFSSIRSRMCDIMAGFGRKMKTYSV